MKRLLPLAGAGAALALTGCSPAVEPPNESAAAGPAAAAADAPLRGIYVARHGQAELAGMKARFPGRFALRGECLVFEGEGATYLPVLPRATPVSVYADRVVIGGRTHPFGGGTVIVGGAGDASGAALLAEKPPAACASLPLLRVSGLQ